jgi:hypothetical protein
VEIVSARWGSSPNAQSNLTGVLQPIEIGSSQDLRELLFHLPNFLGYAGEGVRNESGTHWRRARVVLEGGDWSVTLDAINADRAPAFTDASAPAPPPVDSFQTRLQASRGYGLTHVGRLRRLDGANFRGQDGSDFLDHLFYFFSFCRGAYVSPILLVGKDAAGNCVWEKWAARKISPWKEVGSWFSEFAAQELGQAFKGFVLRSVSPVWDEPLTLAIHWYVESNMCSGGIEGAIIMAQTAFELIAWTLLVEDRRTLGEDGFQKLPAVDKLRLILSFARVPLEVPPLLTELIRAAKGYNWTDGPQVITEMRNALVHANPDKRKKVFGAGTKALFETWYLSLWYLELVLLSLMGYAGRYSNRLHREGWRGTEVETVPWA